MLGLAAITWDVFFKRRPDLYFFKWVFFAIFSLFPISIDILYFGIWMHGFWK